MLWATITMLSGAILSESLGNLVIVVVTDTIFLLFCRS